MTLEEQFPENFIESDEYKMFKNWDITITKKLLQLVEENPRMPIISLVASEVVQNDEALSSWYGAISGVELVEIAEATIHSECKVFDRDDYEELLEYYKEKIIEHSDGEHAEEEIEQLAKKWIDELSWIKCIAIFIGVGR